RLSWARGLAAEPPPLGLVLSVRGPAAVVSSALAGRVVGRWGIGPVLVGAATSITLGVVLVGLAAGPLELAVPLLAASSFLVGIGNPIYNINLVSLRQ